MGSLLLAAVLLVWGCADEPTRPPDVLLITVDTLRADRVGTPGPPATPTLDELARQGIRFDHAVAPAPWTLPSVASIHTGVYPSEHGAVTAQSRVEDATLTLAEVFRAQGYQTLAVVSHDFTDSLHGFAQGFEQFDSSQIRGHDAVTSPGLTRVATELLRRSDPHRPIFLWVHYFDPHFSYVDHDDIAIAATGSTPLPAMLQTSTLDDRLADHGGEVEDFPPAELAYVEGVYAEEIQFTDRWIGELLERHRVQRGERSRVVAVTGDHGEYFLERGRFFHGRDVYEELVHVPLILAGAGIERGEVRPETVSTCNVGRTLLAAAGLRPLEYPGADLRSAAERPLHVFAEGNYAWGTDERKAAVYEAGMKLIHRLDDDGFELYDLTEDPAERHNLLGQPDASRVERRLRALLEDYPPRRAVDGSKVPLDEETRQRLRSLGYTY